MHTLLCQVLSPQRGSNELNILGDNSSNGSLNPGQLPQHRCSCQKTDQPSPTMCSSRSRAQKTEHPEASDNPEQTNKNAQLDLLPRSEAEIFMAKIDSKVIVTQYTFVTTQVIRRQDVCVSYRQGNVSSGAPPKSWGCAYLHHPLIPRLFRRYHLNIDGLQEDSKGNKALFCVQSETAACCRGFESPGLPIVTTLTT